MKRLIMATMVTAILASSTVWAAECTGSGTTANSASSANPENGSGSRAYL